MMRAGLSRSLCLCILTLGVSTGGARAECKSFVGGVCVDKEADAPQKEVVKKKVVKPIVAKAQPATNPSDVGAWETYSWEDMSDLQRKNWTVLGWDAARWSGEKSAPLSDELGWDGLTGHQRTAATQLGFAKISWDATH